MICAFSIAGVLTRPRGIAEWVWALGGAALLAPFGLIPPRDVVRAVTRGSDVYLFLAGMLLLAELARREGVFDWVAGYAVRAARGSPARLFALVYGVGIVVTVVLSNDATAVVLTPAVAAAVRKAKAEPLPYLYACAFIANAASFVLPISNPANLVVFAKAMPTLPQWLATFALPSLLAIVATFVMLGIACRRDLQGAVASVATIPFLHAGGRIALYGIGATATALLVASFVGAPLGCVTFTCGAVVLTVACVRERTVFRAVTGAVSWTVLLFVAGLFVLVRGLDAMGLLTLTRHAFEAMLDWPPLLSLLGAAAIATAASNLTNNLPAGLIVGSGAALLHGHDAFRAALAVGIDLGPNLSVTGSLATVLWLVALRRERIEMDAWTFLRVGALVMPPALVLSAGSIVLSSR